MEDSKLYERLRKLREAHGYTQESLAEALNVNPQAVKAWEKRKDPSDPKLRNLLSLCDLYKCDLDYLIGRIDEQTHDNKTACELTGLSETAIIKIRNQQLKHPMSKVLSHLIESDYFDNLMTSYKIYLEFLAKLKADDFNDTAAWNELSDDKVILSKNSAVKHFRQEVSQAMSEICNMDYTQMFMLHGGWKGKLNEIMEGEKE